MPPACWPYLPACTAQGGAWSGGGSAVQGGVWSGGYLVPRGCLLLGEDAWSGGIPACTEADPPVKRSLNTPYWKILPCPKLRFRALTKRIQFSRIPQWSDIGSVHRCSTIWFYLALRCSSCEQRIIEKSSLKYLDGTCIEIINWNKHFLDFLKAPIYVMNTLYSTAQCCFFSF